LPFCLFLAFAAKQLFSPPEAKASGELPNWLADVALQDDEKVPNIINLLARWHFNSPRSHKLSIGEQQTAFSSLT